MDELEKTIREEIVRPLEELRGLAPPAAKGSNPSESREFIPRPPKPGRIPQEPMVAAPIRKKFRGR